MLIHPAAILAALAVGAPMHVAPGPQPNVRSAATTVHSTNWAGYALKTRWPWQKFTKVTATFRIPRAIPALTHYGHLNMTVFWAGLDGFSTTTVEQEGVGEQVSELGNTTYFAWTECYPAEPMVIAPVKIHAGQLVHVSTVYKNGSFWMHVNGFTRVERVNGAERANAEVITEAPTSSIVGTLPLTAFKTVSYGSSLRGSPYRIELVDSGNTKVLVRTSPFHSGKFVNTWAH